MFDQRFKSERPGIQAPAPANNTPAATESDPHATTTIAIVDEAKVHELTSLSRTTPWRMARRGEFPKRVRSSAGRVGAWGHSMMTHACRNTIAPTPSAMCSDYF